MINESGVLFFWELRRLLCIRFIAENKAQMQQPVCVALALPPAARHL
jgi:hypothetical protein